VFRVVYCLGSKLRFQRDQGLGFGVNGLGFQVPVQYSVSSLRFQTSSFRALGPGV